MNSIHGYTKPFSCVPKKIIPKKDVPGKEQNEIIKDSKILIEFLDETIKSLSKLNSFLDENNINCIISDDTTLDHIYKEDDYIVQDKLQCLRGLINEFQRLQQKSSSILNNDEELDDESDFDNSLKYIYPEFFFSLNYLKNINVEKLIFEAGNKTFSMPNKLFSYLIIEYVNGGNLLFHFNKVGKFTEEQAKFCSAEVACGLLFLHSQNIVHCEILPENILFDSNGHSKIVHSIYTRDLKKCSKSMRSFKPHTLNYISPEYRREGELSFGVDFFAFGHLILQLLVGLDDNPNATISQEAADFIAQLRVFNPAERLGANDKNLKDHPFFKSIDWKKLENGELEPPFKPIVNSPGDMSNFFLENKYVAKELNEYNYLKGNLLPEFQFINDKILASLEVIKIIGCGAFGNVFLAKLESNRIYAIKSINKNDFDKEFINTSIKTKHELVRTEREAGLLGNKCRFITKMYATFQTRTHLFYFMEYLKGGRLEKYLIRHTLFPEHVVRFYTAEILCGLLFLHNQGIIHRDLKCGNVLLDSNGHAKLCDFGFSKKLAENEKTTTYVGTKQYMSPEIVNKREYGYSVDYWSLGICVYFMLTGVEPFKTSEEILNKELPDLNHKRKNKMITAKIKNIPCQFVSKLLTKNPEQRLGSKTLGLNIKEDPFFSDIDWTRLENGQLKPPIKINKKRFELNGLRKLIGNQEIDYEFIGCFKDENYARNEDFKDFDFNVENFLNN